MDAMKLMNHYESLRYWKEREKEIIPVVEAIFAHKDAPFTVREIGEGVYGVEAYNEKRTAWDGKQYRTGDAMSKTATITKALMKLVELDVIAWKEEKDLNHPYVLEDEEELVTVLNDKVLPKYIEIEYNGMKVEIPSYQVKGTQREWRKVSRTVYPKIKYYYFK